VILSGNIRISLARPDAVVSLLILPSQGQKAEEAKFEMEIQIFPPENR
jgi:hypothetical protein